MISPKQLWHDKQSQVVFFSSTAIALYGYDQGMMSLVNTNKDYLHTMGINGDSPLVGIIVSVYYLGCTLGAVCASWLADQWGRKRSIFICICTASLGCFICFISGIHFRRGAMAAMILGRVVMGLGVGGIDAIVPMYSSELSRDDARGKALAIQFQFNIFGLNLAFAINLALTKILGKYNQWAWRMPIILMNLFSVILVAIIGRLPESPRYLLFNNFEDKAMDAMAKLYPDEDERNQKSKELYEERSQEGDNNIGYLDMLFKPSSPAFHPTMVVVLGQVMQALTGYGFVSVYGSQCVMLLGFGSEISEYLIQANYVSYLILMTFAWLLIDAVGRRNLMMTNSVGLIINFLLLAIFGCLAHFSYHLGINVLGPAIPGLVALFVATGNFGIGWLVPPWLVPTEIFETRTRAKGTAISVIIWGLANFAITLLSPILFNNLRYVIFFVFAATNAVAGILTYYYIPETGGRPFEENQKFFQSARELGTWKVKKVEEAEFMKMPYPHDADGEDTPLLRRVEQQIGLNGDRNGGNERNGEGEGRWRGKNGANGGAYGT